MKISHLDHIVQIDDGLGARLGLGVLVPSLLVGILVTLIWPAEAGHYRYDLGLLAFAAEAVILALLMAPRVSEFDQVKREVRLSIGWPPLFGRQLTIPFDTIAEVKVSQLIRLGSDLGSARPVLILNSGKKVLLSAYKRSPKRCREIAGQVEVIVGEDHAKRSA